MLPHLVHLYLRVPVAHVGVPVQSMQKVPISCACKINALEG
jgi:hypothetical protein